MKNKPSSTHVQEITPQAVKSKPGSAADASVALPRRDSLATVWTNFWFTAGDPLALHALRVLAGLVFLSWLLPFAGHVEAFFSLNGWFDRQGYLDMSSLPLQERPLMGWSVLYLFGNSTEMVQALYWITIGVVVLFTLGLATRITGAATWILIVSFVSFLAGPVGRMEDDLLIILAFYLMIGYLFLGQFSRNLSPAERILGPWDTFLFSRFFKVGVPTSAGSSPSHAANLALRLYQVHFAVFLVASGLHKLQFGDWWSGVAYWYPLHPPFETTPASIRAAAPHALSLLFFYSLVQYAALGWQLTFPLWAWRPRCRLLLVGGGVLALIGSFWIYNIPPLGPSCLVGCLAYITSAEWRRLGGLLGGPVPKDTRERSARDHEKRVPLAV